MLRHFGEFRGILNSFELHRQLQIQTFMSVHNSLEHRSQDNDHRQKNISNECRRSHEKLVVDRQVGIFLTRRSLTRS